MTATTARPVVELEALPADEGDCLLLTCQTEAGPRHVLIDGGTPRTAPLLRDRLNQLTARRLELLVVSHIDADHIGGMVRLLRDPAFTTEIGDAWFNGYHHLPGSSGTKGPADGERLADLLTGKADGRAIPWNTAFGGGAVVRPKDDPKTGETTADAPVVDWPWGLRITLLSPTPLRLSALLGGWDHYLLQLRHEQPSEQTASLNYKSGPEALETLAAEPTKLDDAAPNGSSIAFLAEFRGRSLLFCADAFPTVLYPALLRLARARAGLPASTEACAVPPFHVDVFKLPHHGSRANVALQLFDIVRADHYLISTSGNRFGHPDTEAMARVITRGRPAPDRPYTLWFNYMSETTKRWRDPELARKYDYIVAGAGSEDRPGVVIKI
jgi:hypothetical protein